MKRIILFVLLLLSATGTARSAGNDWFLEAKPCWASRMQKEYNYVMALHKCIDVGTYGSARFRIAACSNYRFYLNGEFMGYGPSITAHGFFRVDEYDLASKLRPGTNVLAVEVCGYNVDNFHIPNQSAFVQAECVIDGKVVAATLPKADKAAFQAAYPGQRQYVEVGEVWQRPHLEKYKLSPDFAAWRSNTALVLPELRLEETDAKRLLPRGVPYPNYTIVEASHDGNGLYSFDRIHTGFIRTGLKVTKPSKVTLFWDEVLIDGRLKERRQPHMNMSLELAPGDYLFETFEPYTLMHLKLSVEEGDCSLQSVAVRQYVNADTERASFTTDDEEVNRIFRAAVETYRQNAVDYFMDCPERERAGWLCDSYFTARAAYCLSGNTAVEHNFLENFLLPDKFYNIPEGMLPMCYPSDHRDGNFIPNWAMWFIMELNEYVDRSADYEMVAALKPRVLGLLKYFEEYKNEDGLLEDLNKWVFIEWSEANSYTDGVNYPTNMLYAKVLELTGRLYSMPEYVEEAERIREVIRRQSYVEGFFRDNAIRHDGQLVVQKEHCTEVCQNYAFFLDVATAERYPELWNRLIAQFGSIRDKVDAYPDIPRTNAFIGNYLRLELLSRAGLAQQLVNESKELFLYMANSTGTLWENVTSLGSCCHGFASHAAYIYCRDIAGVTRVDEKNRRIEFTVSRNDLKFCRATFPVGDGLIEIDWKRNGNRIDYAVKVPKGFSVDINNASGRTLRTEVSYR